MTKILIEKKDKRVSKIQISGHADFAKHGQDIVCAAISVLSQSVANAMAVTLDGDESFFSSNQKYGTMTIDVPKNVDKIQRIKLDTLTNLLELSFVDLQEQYKQNISLTIEEV